MALRVKKNACMCVRGGGGGGGGGRGWAEMGSLLCQLSARSPPHAYCKRSYAYVLNYTACRVSDNAIIVTSQAFDCFDYTKFRVNDHICHCEEEIPMLSLNFT